MKARDVALTAFFDYGALQHPDELESVIEIVNDLQPRVVVEVGVAQAGTWYAWCQSAAPDCRLIGIDLPQQVVMRDGFAEAFLISDDREVKPEKKPPAALLTRVLTALREDQYGDVLWGDSTTDLIKAQFEMHPWIRKGVDFLFIDGGHDKETVLNDWTFYSKFVRPGGIVAFHDVAPNEANEGAPEVWRLAREDKDYIEFIAENSPFGIGVLWMP